MRHVFAIRATLNDSVLDTVMVVGRDDSFMLNREFTVRSLLVLLGGLLGLMLILFGTPLEKGGFWGVTFIVIGYTWIVVQLSMPTPSKELGYAYVADFGKYFNKYLQNVSTRNFSSVVPVENLLDIQDDGIDPNGQITFANGDVGEIFELVGNASEMIFLSDLEQVLHDTRVFYRNVRPLTTLTIDTVSRPQRVLPQLMAKEHQIKNLSPVLQKSGIKQLLEYEGEVLQNYVGTTFTTWRQFMIVRSVNSDELDSFNEWLASRLNSQSSFLKSARLLDTDEEVVEYFKDVFTANSKSSTKKEHIFREWKTR